jgi:hypothetical protein
MIVRGWVLQAVEMRLGHVGIPTKNRLLAFYPSAIDGYRPRERTWTRAR